MWSPSLHERRTVVDARDQDARGEDQDAAALGVQAVHAVHMGVDLVVTQGECLGWWRGQGEEVTKGQNPGGAPKLATAASTPRASRWLTCLDVDSRQARVELQQRRWRRAVRCARLRPGGEPAGPGRDRVCAWWATAEVKASPTSATHVRRGGEGAAP